MSTPVAGWALIAGASEGLGAAWADGLAAKGYDLLLVARRQTQLDEVAAKVRATHGRQVISAAIDLGAADLGARMAPLLDGHTLSFMVYNAAVAPVGPFSTQTFEQTRAALDVNCRAVVELTHLVLPGMLAQRRGSIVLMSSLTAFQGTPYTAVYGATKAFNLTFAEGLWAELHGTGVDVLACCAGATRTPKYLKAMPNGAPGELEPAAVVQQALGRLGRGPSMIPGAFNRLASFFMRRVLPRRTAVGIMAAQTKRLQG